MLKMQLPDLPIDLLSLLPPFLPNIEDFTNASSSCRGLRAAFAITSPKTILSLAAASSRTFFRPDPHFLVAATARQVSDWALLSPENTATLRRAFQGGIEALFQLCISTAGLTLDDIRRLHASRFTTINPVADMIDRCAGKQWYQTPDFWYGGVSDAETIGYDPPRSLLQIVIYGELFSSSMRAAMHNPDPGKSQEYMFDLSMRLDYIIYCIPDWHCWPDGGVGIETDHTGPYSSYDIEDRSQIDDDQTRLNHILNCRTWREAWAAVRAEIGPDFDDDWQQQLWTSAVQQQGFEGLEMLRPGGVEKWRSRLLELRRRIEGLDPRTRLPEYETVHGLRRRKFGAVDAPSMCQEIQMIQGRHWRSEYSVDGDRI